MPESAIAPAERTRLQAVDGFALIALLGVVLSLSWLFRDSIIDDGYIYLRVVDNILAGHGWVFNVGERVNPCTSIPYTLLLALIRLLCRSPIATILTGFGMGMLGMSWIQYWAFHEWNRALGFAIALASVCDASFWLSRNGKACVFGLRDGVGSRFSERKPVVLWNIIRPCRAQSAGRICFDCPDVDSPGDRKTRFIKDSPDRLSGSCHSVADFFTTLFWIAVIQFDRGKS